MERITIVKKILILVTHKLLVINYFLINRLWLMSRYYKSLSI